MKNILILTFIMLQCLSSSGQKKHSSDGASRNFITCQSLIGKWLSTKDNVDTLTFTRYIVSDHAPEMYEALHYSYTLSSSCDLKDSCSTIKNNRGAHLLFFSNEGLGNVCYQILSNTFLGHSDLDGTFITLSNENGSSLVSYKKLIVKKN